MRATDEIQFMVSESLYGPMLVAQSPRGVCAVLFGSDREALLRDLQGRFPGVMLVDGGAKVEALAARCGGLRGSARLQLGRAARCARDGVPAQGLAGAA